MRYILFLLFIPIILFAQDDDSSEAIDYKYQKITHYLTDEPPKLDSTKDATSISVFVLGHTNEGLLRYDRENNLTGGIAEEYEFKPTSAWFKIRKDARWSDGSPVTAHDFVFAWRKVVDPVNASKYAAIMEVVKNARSIINGELPITALGVEAINDYELRVTLENPCGHFPALMTFSSFYPIKESFYKRCNGKYAAEADKMLYNGPFKLVEWTHGSRLKLVKNEHYWDHDNIKLNEIDIPYITANANTAIRLFKEKKLAVAQLDAETIREALASKLYIQQFSSGTLFYLEFNQREGSPFRNKNLRKALQYAFDPDEMINKIVGTPGNRAGVSHFPCWLKGVNKSFREEFPVRLNRPDLPKARKYLELARKELGEIPEIDFVTGDSPNARKSAVYIKSVVKQRLGLEFRLIAVDFKQRLARMNQGEFDIVAAGWGPDFFDPLTFADLFCSTNANNRGRYSNKEYDAAIKESTMTTDPKKRMQAFGRAQKILLEDVGVLPTYEASTNYILHRQIKGLRRNVVGPDPDFRFSEVIEVK